MSALLSDSFFIHDHNPVGIFDCRQTVSDDECGSAYGQISQGLLNRGFGLCIQRGSSFIQNQNRRILEEHASDSQALLLSTGQLHTALPDDCLHSIWQILE